VGAIPDIIEDGRNGLLVPSGDGQIIAKAVLGAARDGKGMDRMGAAAVETIRTRFTPSAVVRKWKEVLECKPRP
jgi:glycosyltransferase involved in cell wall biosynthesis